MPLPSLLAKPWAIFPSTSQAPSGRVIAALPARDDNGDPILAVLSPEPDGIVTVSIYGKEARGVLSGDDAIRVMIANARQAGGKVMEAGSPPAVYSDPISDMRPARQKKPILSLPGKGKFDQRAAAGPQGSIQFTDAGVLIRLFERANLSTFQHEMAHFWLERFMANALAATDTDGNPAARQTFADWETLKAWFKQNGHEIGPDNVIPEGAHELFARSWERYLMEGKAPTTRLQSVFRKFAHWLASVYRTVKSINAPISPEVREVMDRNPDAARGIDRARRDLSAGAVLCRASAIAAAAPTAGPCRVPIGMPACACRCTARSSRWKSPGSLPGCSAAADANLG